MSFHPVCYLILGNYPELDYQETGLYIYKQNRIIIIQIFLKLLPIHNVSKIYLSYLLYSKFCVCILYNNAGSPPISK